MKRISKKRLQEFINLVADVKLSSIPDDFGMCYYSKIDGSYMGRVGMGINLKFLLKRGITDRLQNNENKKTSTTNIGFNPDEKKWYGWSRRAIYGFGIGSKCKKGDCGYIANTPQNLFDDITKKDENGWQWQEPENVEILDSGIRIKIPMSRCIGSDGSEFRTSEFITNACDEIINKKDTANFIPIPCEAEYFEIKCGNGEWMAKSLKDARRMACDFANGVS